MTNVHRRCRSVFLWLAVGVANAAPPVPVAAPPKVRIALVPGLTIVTAIEDRQGDYESIKRVLAVDDKSVLIRYSAQQPVHVLGGEQDAPTLKTTVVNRRVLRRDLERSAIYLQQFGEHVPETVAGATAVGTSRDVLRAVKRGQEVELTVFQPLLPGNGPANPLDRQPGEIDYRLSGSLRKQPPTRVRVIVNGQPMDLPAVHAKAEMLYEEQDFQFLDDEDNPLTLRFDIGLSRLRVIRIDSPVAVALPPEGPGAKQGSAPVAGSTDKASTAAAAGMEKALAAEGRVDTYGIYFDFNSAVLRPESDLALQAIADALKKNPAWTLRLIGHTDGVGGDAFNQDLSRRRAAAAREALVSRYGIAPARLGSDGRGATQPKAPNTTLEGRALNRRVELLRG